MNLILSKHLSTIISYQPNKISSSQFIAVHVFFSAIYVLKDFSTARLIRVECLLNLLPTFYFDDANY